MSLYTLRSVGLGNLVIIEGEPRVVADVEVEYRRIHHTFIYIAFHRPLKNEQERSVWDAKSH